MGSLLYCKTHKITDKISVRVPTVRDILDNEDEYYSAVALFVSTPYDMMAQLDSVGIDFTEINDWDLFCLMFRELQRRDLSLIFDDLDLSKFIIKSNEKNGEIIFVNEELDIVIDRGIHTQITNFLRDVLNIERHDKKPANEEAKKYMIERARKKLRRQKRNKTEHQLEHFIISLVNTAEFSYDYQSVLDLTIYQFNVSLRQIIKKVKFDKLMIGCYAGTVNTKTIDPSELVWISN